MKKFKLFIFSIFALILMPSIVCASSASISVSASDTVMVGNKVTVTVKISSSNNIGSWQMDLSYDKSYLQLTSSNAESSGTAMANSSAGGTKSKSYTFTFKALKSGSTKLSINSYDAYDYDTMSSMSIKPGSKTINIKTKEQIEASYSSNAFLKSITVGEYTLDPEFNKNTKEYTVEVPNEIEKVTINAQKEDGNASISGTGEKDLVEGNNKFEVVCTAQKGNSINYVINVYRKELDPIIVNINGKELSIIRKSASLDELSTFTLDVVKYGEDEVPALKSDITGYVLLGLKDESGNISYYLYENGKIGERYYEVKGNNLSIYPIKLPENDLFNTYFKRKIFIDGEEVLSYSLSKKSKTVIIYGQNIETGDIKYYSYNIDENSIQSFDKEILETSNENEQKYKYIIIGEAIVIALLIFFLVIKKTSKKVYKSKHEISQEDDNDDKALSSEELKKEQEKIDKEIEEELKKEQEKKDLENKEKIKEEQEEDFEEKVKNGISKEELIKEAEKIAAKLEKEKEVREEKILEKVDQDDDFIEEEFSKTKQLTRAERRKQRKEEKRALRDF